MNSIIFIIFICLFAAFAVLMFVFKKTSISDVIFRYFRNYYKNAEKEEDRKFSIWLLIVFGIMPYALGALLFFAFKDYCLKFDTNLLIQIDIILLTIFCLFIAFDFKRKDKKYVKLELVATLMINILFVVISAILLLFASSIYSQEIISNKQKIVADVLYCIYYAIHFKVFVLFFYSLKRVYKLSDDSEQ